MFMGTTNKSIHAAERLLCGCYADTNSGARFITCPAHSNLPAVDPLAKRDGMRPLCVCCASQRIQPAGINLLCLDCDALFAAADITGYGLSDDGGPRKCACGAVHYGRTDTCELCSRTEASP